MTFKPSRKRYNLYYFSQVEKAYDIQIKQKKVQTVYDIFSQSWLTHKKDIHKNR